MAEADEATARCWSAHPDVAVVTNIDADHLDFFGSRAAYAAVFDAFVERRGPGVARWWCAWTTRAAALAERTVRHWGSGAALRQRAGCRFRCAAGQCWSARNSGAPARWPTSNCRRAASTGDTDWRCPDGTWRSTRWGRCWPPSRPGRRSTTYWTGWPARGASAVASELVGTDHGVPGLRRLRASPDRVRAAPDRAAPSPRRTAPVARRRTAAGPIVVFQPHLYSRCKTFAREFGAALDNADGVFVLDVLRRLRPLPV